MKQLLNILDETLIQADQTYIYKIWKQFTKVKEDLHSITLKWCHIVKGNFCSTLMANSDLDSCHITECIFSNLSMQNSDICSTYFENSSFYNVNFSGSTMSDITFINCNFVDCNFNHIVLASSIFKNCTLENFKLRQSSTSLNHFISCEFVKVYIGGNFFFNIFSNTVFKSSEISEDLFANNFGFTKRNLEELSCSREQLKLLQQKFLNEKDVISAATISLNLEKNLYEYAIWVYIQVIVNQLKHDILVRSEQLNFFKIIIEYLLNEGNISLYSTLYIVNLLESIQKNKDENIAIQKAYATINQIYNMLLYHYNQNIIKIHNENLKIKQNHIPITFKVTYTEQPNISLCKILSEIMNSMEIAAPFPQRIKTEKGSFIEWIQGYDNILKCLQLLVSILGLGSKFIAKKEPETNSDNIDSSNKNDTIENETAQENMAIFQIPESILNQISTTQTEKEVTNVINILVINGININNNFQGYNNFNIQKIEIL